MKSEIMVSTFILFLVALSQGIDAMSFWPSSSSEPNSKQSKGNPTLIPAAGFNDNDVAKATDAAEKLHKALSGWGTNEKTLNKISSTHGLNQRLQIRNAYKTKYNKDLIDVIEGDTSYSYENLLVALYKPTVQVVCHDLRQAMKSMGTDEDDVLEIIVTSCQDDKMKKEMLDVYAQSYKGRKLEEDIKGDLDGDTANLMIELLKTPRKGKPAKNDAQVLHEESNKWPTNMDVLKKVLFTYPMAQLQTICKEFQKLHGTPLHKVIKDKIGKLRGNFLSQLAYLAENPAEYYATVLHKAMDKNFRTNDSTLIRIVVTHCEVDLGDIKNAYKSVYGKSLIKDIKGETSKDYEDLLVKLCGD